MEVNRDEAERALSIAQRKWQKGDHAGGLKLARKSHALFPTESSKQLVEKYEQEPKSQSSSSSSSNAKAPAAEGPKAEGLRNRAKKEPAAAPEEQQQQRTYTQEQAAAVKRVVEIRNDYYQVLGVERAADDAAIKKAYRKSALAFHPDKNTAPGASEAFKLVAHAFNILSDQDKRAHYDRFGADMRSSGPAQPAPRQRGAAAFGGGGGGGFGVYEDEISPEDLFNMFFGGGDLGRFNVQFGPNGGQRHGGIRFGPRGPVFQQQQRRQGNDRTGIWASCMQLLPLILLVLSFFASSMVSLFAGSDSSPTFAFERTPPRYTTSRATNARNVVYWINPQEFQRTGIAKSTSRLWQFEREVEAQYISRLQYRCRQQRENKRTQIQMAQGWFGIGTDQKRLEAAQALPLPACEELRRFR
ncbi:Chaperone protein dnaJ [Coemansia sp. RSA 552]|nr:Chaperone protein dnaJ [Coemansia sp. RSA 552]